MIEIFAIYLLLGLAILMMLVTLWKRIWWVAIAGGIAWIIVGVSTLAAGGAVGSLIIQGLGAICLFAGIGTWIIPITSRTRPVIEPPVPYDHVKDIDDRLEYYRKAKRRIP